MSMTPGLPDALARVSAARGIAADHLGDLEEFANEVLRKTTASG